MPPRAIVLMGVSGCGKTSVGVPLAAALRTGYIEADDYHPEANRRKMAAGTPLTDADRWPWLDALAGATATIARAEGGVVTTCSALKRTYRERLAAAADLPLTFVWLDVPKPVLAQRLRARRNHYMPASLLDSQLATLEPPTADEAVLRVDGNQPLAILIAGLAARLR